jgi:hypothetical protein
MTKSSVISVRLKLELLDKIQEYSDLLNIRPSTLIALIIEDSLEDWVKDQSEKVYTKLWRKS